MTRQTSERRLGRHRRLHVRRLLGRDQQGAAMTALWASLDDNQQAVLICAVTLLLGLFIGALGCRNMIRAERAPMQPDLGVDEYREAADPIDVAQEYWTTEDERLAAWEWVRS